MDEQAPEQIKGGKILHIIKNTDESGRFSRRISVYSNHKDDYFYNGSIIYVQNLA